MARCIELRPAFILTELRFPDGNGLELVRWISKHLPAARTVVHTWFADITTAVATVKAGAEDFVPKPTDAELLMNILLVGTKMVPADCGIETPNRVRQQHIEQVMKFSRSNVTLAARNLHLHRRSLSRMLKRYRALPLLPMPIER
jgi:two-component system response regulator RegA